VIDRIQAMFGIVMDATDAAICADWCEDNDLPLLAACLRSGDVPPIDGGGGGGGGGYGGGDAD
jgi:hypothetical protein